MKTTILSVLALGVIFSATANASDSIFCVNVDSSTSINIALDISDKEIVMNYNESPIAVTYEQEFEGIYSYFASGEVYAAAMSRYVDNIRLDIEDKNGEYSLKLDDVKGQSSFIVGISFGYYDIEEDYYGESHYADYESGTYVCSFR